MAVYDDTLADALKMAGTEDVVRAQRATSLDGIGLSESCRALYGLLTTERVNVKDPLVANSISNVDLLDLVRVLAKLFAGRQEALTDGIGIAETVQLQALFQIIDRLGIADVPTAAGSYNLTLVQALRLTDSLAQFFGVDVSESVGLGEALLARALANAGLVDTVGVADAITPRLLLNVLLGDGVDITAEMAARMLFSPTILEGIEISAGYLAPDGSLTTWVMNTRSAAVTEYSNFNFNSFAQIGGRYFGASTEGLYELLGDDDDGAGIIARIKSGYLQFGGTQLSRLKEAYIAATGEGAMVLRIITKDGVTYNYGVSTRDGRSTKVHMGKGQRSRYFAFELVSAGQDFDLDTLEFVPIVVERRV